MHTGRVVAHVSWLSWSANPLQLVPMPRLADTLEAARGVVSAAGNRRAFRISEEPLDSFRRYMSVYAREQAHCHFSPALIANLERNWNAASRRA